MVERNLAKVEVESSRLFSRSNFHKKGSICFPFLSECDFWRGGKAVMPRIANPVSPVRLRTAPPDSSRALRSEDPEDRHAGGSGKSDRKVGCFGFAIG